jgi:hypothetical protein
MVFLSVAILVALVAVGLLFFGLRLLFGRHWLLGWLRGMLGIAFTALAAALALAAWDLHSYRQVQTEQPIATLAFSKLEPKRFSVVVGDQNGDERRLELSGDMWQLDVRLLKWADALARLGLKPGYRLDRLSGRYLSLEDEQQLPRTVLALTEHQPAVDAWHWLHQLDRYLPVIDAQYGSATYMPMIDGALFSVGMGSSGLVARPLNDRAKLAIEQWQ